MIKTVIKRTRAELERDDAVGKITFERFNECYGEVYNLIDLVFEKEKAEYAKGLIGGILKRLRINCNEDIINMLNQGTTSDEVT